MPNGWNVPKWGVWVLTTAMAALLAGAMWHARRIGITADSNHASIVQVETEQRSMKARMLTKDDVRKVVQESAPWTRDAALVKDTVERLKKLEGETSEIKANQRAVMAQLAAIQRQLDRLERR